MEVVETTPLFWWIAEKFVFLVLVPIGIFIAGYIHGYTKRNKEYETDFDFDKQKEAK